MARKKWLYGLFVEDEETGKMVRLFPDLALRKARAVVFWQSFMLDATLDGRRVELRPVEEDTYAAMEEAWRKVMREEG